MTHYISLYLGLHYMAKSMWTLTGTVNRSEDLIEINRVLDVHVRLKMFHLFVFFSGALDP